MIIVKNQRGKFINEPHLRSKIITASVDGKKNLSLEGKEISLTEPKKIEDDNVLIEIFVPGI